MKSKKTLLVLIALLSLIAMISGVAVAYMFDESDHIRNEFQPALVDCEVHEVTTDTQKTSIKVENTGYVKAYIRVRLVAYWVKADDETNAVVADKPVPELEIVKGENWIAGLDNTFYYKRPVTGEPGALNHHLTNDNLLGAPIDLREEDGCKLVVEVIAEAVQADPQNAVIESWGVTLYGTGDIQTVPTS